MNGELKLYAVPNIIVINKSTNNKKYDDNSYLLSDLNKTCSLISLQMFAQIWPSQVLTSLKSYSHWPGYPILFPAFPS